jgi:hypothetical protein
MSINFFEENCKTVSNKKNFGIVDYKPARIDETNGSIWELVVKNEKQKLVSFFALDLCLKVKRKDGKWARQCEGFLFYEKNILFVELKSSSKKGADWVKEAEEQLRVSISFFLENHAIKGLKRKEAYISNSQKPKFGSGQANRIAGFYKDTRFILNIHNRIEIW